MTVCNRFPGLSAALVLMLLLSPAAPGANLAFGVQGAAGQRTLEMLWRPLLDDLGRALGTRVEARYFDNYADTVTAFADGRLQLAWLGNKNAIAAVDQAGAEIFAQVLTGHGVPGYYSLLIVRADRDLADFEAVWRARHRLSLSLGDPDSTSGTIVPLYFLFAEQDREVGGFAAVRHGNHEANFHAVVNGEVDVATISSVMLQRFESHFPEQAAQLAQIWASPLIPSDPLLWDPALPPSVKQRIRDFFLDYGRVAPGKDAAQVARERRTLAATKWSGFTVSGNSQLRYVRVLADFAAAQQTADAP